MIIRWRNSDPAEHYNRLGATAWTKVHVLIRMTDKLRVTACGIDVPEFPYIEDIDDQIPQDAPRCKLCAKASR